jgi:hypothetical protein
LVFWFHEDNNHIQKFATIALTAVVAPVILGAAFGYANPPNIFFPLAALWGIIIAKTHNMELNNFAGVEYDFTNDDGGDDGGD